MTNEDQTPAADRAEGARPSGTTTTHIDPAWRDRFLLEQRLADRSGEQIGDALATVDAHCAESGESAEEAFGDPAAYSRSLVGEAVGPPTRIAPRTVVGIASGLLALLTVPRAVEAWVEGSEVSVSGGDLAGALVVALLATALFRWPTPVLSWVLRRPANGIIGVFGVLILLIIPMALLRDPLLTTGWAPLLAVGLVLLVLSVVLPWSDLSGQDPVRDPRAGAAATPSALGWFTAFLFPLLTVIMLGMDALFRLL